MAATSTMNITNVLNDAEESIAPVVKEVERTFLFTDVPCGALKYKPDCTSINPADTKDDVAQSLLTFCGGLERAFCFSDLEDMNEADIERLKSMKSIEEAAAQKEEPPAVEPADTESLSDDSAAKDAEDVAVKKVDPVDDEKNWKPVEPATPATPKEDKVAEEAKKSDNSLPPANALQASSNKANDGKPHNSLQAAKSDKKKDGKKGWSMFRKSNKAPAEKPTTPTPAPKEKALPPANALQAASKKANDGKPHNALQAAKAAKKKDGKKSGWSMFRRSNKKGSV